MSNEYRPDASGADVTVFHQGEEIGHLTTIQNNQERVTRDYRDYPLINTDMIDNTNETHTTTYTGVEADGAWHTETGVFNNQWGYVYTCCPYEMNLMKDTNADYYDVLPEDQHTVLHTDCLSGVLTGGNLFTALNTNTTDTVRDLVSINCPTEINAPITIYGTGLDDYIDNRIRISREDNSIETDNCFSIFVCGTEEENTLRSIRETVEDTGVGSRYLVTYEHEYSYASTGDHISNILREAEESDAIICIIDDETDEYEAIACCMTAFNNNKLVIILTTSDEVHPVLSYVSYLCGNLANMYDAFADMFYRLNRNNQTERGNN